MTALLIAAGILALVLLLLLAPVSLGLAWNGEDFGCTVYYLLFHYRLTAGRLEAMTAKKPEKEKKRRKKKRDEPEEQEEKKTVRQRARETKDLAGMVWETVKSSRKALTRLRRGLMVDRLDLRVSVSAEDAHQTAMRYSAISAGAAILLSVLDSLFVLKRHSVHVFPDFTKDKMEADCSVRLGIRPITVLAALVTGLAAFLRTDAFRKLTRRNKHGKHPGNKQNNNLNKQKGGRVYESAASHQ